ncbi:MAG: acetylornithine deacetylase [Pseudohongiellaceae bacterium]|jgi:acetylornithine deacetylase
MRVDVVTLTERLVAVDTAPGLSTNPLVQLLADEARGLGAVVALQDGVHEGVPQQNLVVRFGGDGPAGLVLAGHIDTVPWSAGQRATATPERAGTTLFGRGTCDMKGAVAAQLEAAAAQVERLSRPLVLCWTYAEEVGCHGAVALVDQQGLMGDLSDARCIVGEPTGLVPITAHKGYGVVGISLRGEPAHSSNPWAGADASVPLGSLLRNLHALREVLRSEGNPQAEFVPPCTTLNTGLVTAGVARNVVPPVAEIIVECRPLPGADVADLQKRIDSCIELACAAAPGVSGHSHWHELRPAFDQPRDDKLVQWLSQHTGFAPGAVPFYTEAEIYRSGLAVPTVVCGPGSIEQAHRVDESVAFEQLAAGQALYEDAIAAFCC